MKNKLSFVIGFILPILIAILLVGYENTTMHPNLNKRMVDKFTGSFNTSYGFSSAYTFKLNDDQFSGPKVINTGLKSVDEADASLTAQGWISHGGFSCDEPELAASLRHFYDPFATSGVNYLTDLVNGVVASYAITNPRMDAKTWALTAADNKWNLNAAKDNLKKALETSDSDQRSRYFALAYRALGETLHLLADMGCPPHVRNDAHPAYLAGGDDLYGDCDPYEELVGYVENLAFQSPKEIAELTALFRDVKTFDEMFDLMAVFTNYHFFSDDTQAGENITPNNGLTPLASPYIGLSVLLDPADNYYYSDIGGYVIKMTEAKSYFFGGKYPKITYECVKDQAEILLPAVVEAGANAIKLFIPKFAVTIMDADNEGYLEGKITHSKTDEWKDEIKYTGPVEIYEGTNLLGILNAVNGVLLESNFALTADTDITAKINSGGIQITSNVFTVKDKVTDPGCWDVIKSRKYVTSSLKIDASFTDGKDLLKWEHVPTNKSILSVPPNYQVFHQTEDYPEVSWSGNSFSVEEHIVTEHENAVYINTTTSDTVYLRIEGTLSQDGTEILGAYIYWSEYTTTYNDYYGLKNKKEKVVSYRISNMPMYGCASFSSEDPVKVQSYVSNVVWSEKDIQYVKNYQTNGYDVFEVKKDVTISNIKSLPWVSFGFANMPF